MASMDAVNPTPLKLCDLPLLTLEHIARSLEWRDLLNLGAVCRVLRTAATRDSVWFALCARRGWIKFGLPGSGSLLGTRESQLEPSAPRQRDCGGSSSSGFGTSPVFDSSVDDDTELWGRWKLVYLKAQFLDKNWARGRYLVSQPLRCSQSTKGTIRAFACNSRLAATGTDDGLVCVWHCYRVQLMAYRQLDQQICSICLGSPDSGRDFLYVGCDNGTAFELEFLGESTESKAQPLVQRRCFLCCSDSGTCGGTEVQLLKHVRSADFLQLSSACNAAPNFLPAQDPTKLQSNLLVAYTSDGALSAWRLDTGARIGTCPGHSPGSELAANAVSHQLLATGSWDCTALLYDCLSCTQLGHLIGHTEAVSCLWLDAQHHRLASGSLDGSVRLWRFRSDGADVECTAVQRDCHPEVYCLAGHGDLLASGGSDSCILVCDWSGRQLHRLAGHVGVVRNLCMNEFRLVSSGDVRKVLVWDYRCGQLLNTLHRNPSLVQFMHAWDTGLVLAAPGKAGCLIFISYW